MDKKIYVWGTGNIGKSVVQNGIMGEMEGWVETIPSLREVNGKRVIGPEDLTGNEIVVVATIYADEIFESLQKENLLLKQILREVIVNEDFKYIKENESFKKFLTL